MALYIVSDCVVPPLAPLSYAEPGSLVLSPELYAWDGVVREGFSVPPVWLGAMLEQEAAYLEHRWQLRVSEEGAQGRWIKLMERGAEAQEEERRASQGAPMQPSADGISTARETTFP
ncbi:Pre-mRNA-processing factor 39 [Hordeum vulgare]|nr:Pre-mRNA-processing factor 39 [Hordeum vulgare]